MARVSKSQALRVLEGLSETNSQLKAIKRGSPEFNQWQTETETAVKHIFTDDAPDKLERLRRISYSLWVIHSGTTESDYQGAYLAGLEEAGGVLKAFTKEVEQYWEDDEPMPSSQMINQQGKVASRSVFLIHGRDHGAREVVARFLEGLDLEVTILEDEPNRGRTVVEKFEQSSGADFAVALFTPDDVGGLSQDDLKPRARQNVVLEYGYYLGKFDRDRVFALVKGDIEMPSDISGVLFTKMDEAGGWKMKLMQELKAAGFDIDANRAV